MSNIKMQPKKNWISENIVGVIAIAFTLFTFIVFSVILFHPSKVPESTTITILTSITNMMFMILGYYFVSSKTSKEKDKQIEDLMQKPSSIENIEKININTQSNEKSE